MIAMQTSSLELQESWHDERPHDRARATFPLLGVPDAESLGMVYFEVQPGDSLGLHTDSKDEIAILLSGSAIATIGDETAEVRAGGVAFIPGMVPHGFENTGNEPLRVVGIFAGSDVVSTFEYALQPLGTRVIEHQALLAGV